MSNDNKSCATHGAAAIKRDRTVRTTKIGSADVLHFMGWPAALTVIIATLAGGAASHVYGATRVLFSSIQVLFNISDTQIVARETNSKPI
jgi:hypothetical protein